MYGQDGTRISMIDPAIDHKIDIISLSILFVGFFSCLIRSDYNFVVVFFCYFAWQQRKDTLCLRLIMASLIILFVFDLIFLLTEINIWTSTDDGNPVWQTIKPLHGFGIFCYGLINLLKILLLVFVCKGISQTSKAVQPR